MPAMGEKEGGQGCESLRGMGSGILLVMYYTPRPLGKGVGGVQLWVCANSHCAKTLGAGDHSSLSVGEPSVGKSNPGLPLGHRS